MHIIHLVTGADKGLRFATEEGYAWAAEAMPQVVDTAREFRGDPKDYKGEPLMPLTPIAVDRKVAPAIIVIDGVERPAKSDPDTANENGMAVLAALANHTGKVGTPLNHLNIGGSHKPYKEALETTGI